MHSRSPLARIEPDSCTYDRTWHLTSERAMDHTYVKPEEVFSPKRHWKLLGVLESGNESGGSVALGRWEDKPVLAMRWNGNSENPLGNPQSRGLPTWFIVPSEYTQSILEAFSEEKRNFAKTFLSL